MFDDIINLIYLLPSKYRANAKFLVHNSNIREMRKLKDSQNRYLWNEAVAPGQPATFYGYGNAPINREIDSKSGEFGETPNILDRLKNLFMMRTIPSQAII